MGSYGFIPKRGGHSIDAVTDALLVLGGRDSAAAE
jgi:hypothetical protein